MRSLAHKRKMWVTVRAQSRCTLPRGGQSGCQCLDVVPEHLKKGGGWTTRFGKSIRVEFTANLGPRFAADLLQQTGITDVLQENGRYLLCLDLPNDLGHVLR